jgi:hypothetical protein
MSERKTLGFGCPNDIDPHHFVVEIAAGKTDDVVISEHYGIKALRGQPEIAERCYLPRHAWAGISEEVKREFNQRLKEKNLTGGRWTVGENKVERLLGKELLVLAWAVEQADESMIPNAVRNWIGLKPEERWWLYTMTAAATGSPFDAGIGWRKALQHALTENPLKERALPPGKRNLRKTRAVDTSSSQMRLPIAGIEDARSAKDATI